jgi:hypothetical protein
LGLFSRKRGSINSGTAKSQLFREWHDVLCSIIIMDPDLMDSGTFWAGRIRNFLSGSGFYCISAQFRKYRVRHRLLTLHIMFAWQWLLRGTLIAINPM